MGDSGNPSGSEPKTATPGGEEPGGPAQPEAEARGQEAPAGKAAPGPVSKAEEREADPARLAVECERLQALLEEKERHARDNYDRFLRERADLENFKRRTQRERGEALKYACEALTKDLLPVIDNLERAIVHAEQGGNDQPVVQGLSLILKSFLDVLERHGIKQISTKGELFDPAVHEAMAHVETESEEPNRVIEEYHKGYTLHERLLRPAAVVVAKAPEAGNKEGSGSGGQVEKPQGDG